MAIKQKRLIDYVSRNYFCQQTQKWVFRFNVGDDTEEAAHKTFEGAKTAAYKRIAELINRADDRSDCLENVIWLESKRKRMNFAGTKPGSNFDPVPPGTPSPPTAA